MTETIYLPKWTDVLVSLYNLPKEHRYCGRLYRKTGITIRHLRELIAHLESRDLVCRCETGKIKYIALTESGTRIAELFLQIYALTPKR